MTDVTKIIPVPLLFNVWKHHLGFIVGQIRKTEKNRVNNLADSLKKLGANQLDLYLGTLSPEKLSEEIIHQLYEKKVYGYEVYRQWLGQLAKQYQVISISDGSAWTLRQGLDTARYVHLHPARYALHTVRVRAVTLKTAILAAAFAVCESKKLTKEDINYVRQEYLNESPVAQIHTHHGLGKTIKLMEKHLMLPILG